MIGSCGRVAPEPAVEATPWNQASSLRSGVSSQSANPHPRTVLIIGLFRQDITTSLTIALVINVIIFLGWCIAFPLSIPVLVCDICQGVSLILCRILEVLVKRKPGLFNLELAAILVYVVIAVTTVSFVSYLGITWYNNFNVVTSAKDLFLEDFKRGKCSIAQKLVCEDLATERRIRDLILADTQHPSKDSEGLKITECASAAAKGSEEVAWCVASNGAIRFATTVLIVTSRSGVALIVASVTTLVRLGMLLVKWNTVRRFNAMFGR
jgi:hypothetical protein